MMEDALAHLIILRIIRFPELHMQEPIGMRDEMYRIRKVRIDNVKERPKRNTFILENTNPVKLAWHFIFNVERQNQAKCRQKLIFLSLP